MFVEYIERKKYLTYDRNNYIFSIDKTYIFRDIYLSNLAKNKNVPATCLKRGEKYMIYEIKSLT